MDPENALDADCRHVPSLECHQAGGQAPQLLLPVIANVFPLASGGKGTSLQVRITEIKLSQQPD